LFADVPKKRQEEKELEDAEAPPDTKNMNA